MKTETLSFNAANGTATAFAAKPDNTTENPKTIILIHEWWGLNNHIKSIAERYTDEGFSAVTPDLYRGNLATNPEEAAKLMADLQTEDGLDIIKNTISKTSEAFGVSRFGISGYCMGGTFALRAACEFRELSAAAPYYGDIPSEEILKNLTVPVVFVSGTKDTWIDPAKVAELESVAKTHGLPIDSIKYDADHAFSNNTRPEVYDRDAAEDAWTKVIGFFNDKL